MTTAPLLGTGTAPSSNGPASIKTRTSLASRISSPRQNPPSFRCAFRTRRHPVVPRLRSHLGRQQGRPPPPHFLSPWKSQSLAQFEADRKHGALPSQSNSTRPPRAIQKARLSATRGLFRASNFPPLKTTLTSSKLATIPSRSKSPTHPEPPALQPTPSLQATILPPSLSRNLSTALSSLQKNPSPIASTSRTKKMAIRKNHPTPSPPA